MVTSFAKKLADAAALSAAASCAASAASFARGALAALALLAVVCAAHPARAEDGGNDVCPAQAAEADDVRERYDAENRLVHQLRLLRNQKVQEVAIVHRDGHATERTEVVPGHVRVARTQWDGDNVVRAECLLDGKSVAVATYSYVDGRLVQLEKRVWHAAAASTASPPAAEGATPEPPAPPPPARAAANGEWRTEITRNSYDADGRLVASEVRRADGTLISATRAERTPNRVPVQLSLSAGGSYQSDTALYDFTAGFGIHRKPQIQRYGADPLEVGLDGTFKFHRAAGVTSTDQTTLRFAADYHEILPRITLFTFTSTERNLPANLRLNLEEAVLGVKLDIVPRAQYQLDVSFAPVWNYRAIITPEGGMNVEESTSKLRGSLRLRAGVHRPNWSLLDTFEFLPTFFGDDVAQENDFWNRTVLRNTVELDVNLTQNLALREEFKYKRDRALRAQANCPDAGNALCRGYSVASTTSIVLKVDL